MFSSRKKYQEGAFENASRVTRMGIYDENLRNRNEYHSKTDQGLEKSPEKISSNWFWGAVRKMEKLVPELRKRVMTHALAGFIMIGSAGGAIMPDKKSGPSDKKAKPELVKDKIGKTIAQGRVLVGQALTNITGKDWHYDGGVLLQQFGKKEVVNYKRDQQKSSPRGHAKQFDRDQEATRVEFAGSAEKAVMALDKTMKEELKPVFENWLWATESDHNADNPEVKTNYPKLNSITIVGRASAEGRTGVATKKSEVEKDNIALGYIRALTEGFNVKDEMQKMNKADLYKALTARNDVARAMYFTPEKISEISKQLGRTPEDVNDILNHIKLESEAMILDAEKDMDVFEDAFPAFGITEVGKAGYLELAKKVNEISRNGEQDPRLKNSVFKQHYSKVLQILKSQRSAVIRLDYDLSVHKTQDVALPLWLLVPAAVGGLWFANRRRRRDGSGRQDAPKGGEVNTPPVLPSHPITNVPGEGAGKDVVEPDPSIRLIIPEIPSAKPEPLPKEFQERLKIEMSTEEFRNRVILTFDRLIHDMEDPAKSAEMMQIVGLIVANFEKYPKAVKPGVGGVEFEEFILRQIIQYRTKYGFGQGQESVAVESISKNRNWEEKRAELIKAFDVQKKLVRELNEKWKLESEQLEKAKLYTTLKKEQRYLRQIEEALDTKNHNFVLRRGDAEALESLKLEYNKQRKLYQELDEKYKLANENLDKPNLYSKSRVAYKKMLDLEEKLDKDFAVESAETKFVVTDRRVFPGGLENEAFKTQKKQGDGITRETGNEAGKFSASEVERIYLEAKLIKYAVVYDYRNFEPSLQNSTGFAGLLMVLKGEALRGRVVAEENKMDRILNSATSVGASVDSEDYQVKLDSAAEEGRNRLSNEDVIARAAEEGQKNQSYKEASLKAGDEIKNIKSLDERGAGLYGDDGKIDIPVEYAEDNRPVTIEVGKGAKPATVDTMVKQILGSAFNADSIDKAGNRAGDVVDRTMRAWRSGFSSGVQRARN